MSIVESARRAPEGARTTGRAAATSVRAAFDALVRAARARPTSVLAPGPLTGLERAAWLDGLGEALVEVPALVLAVTPAAVTLGDTPVLDGADRGFAEGLHAAGARTIVVFAGAPDAELLALASVIVAEGALGAVGLAGRVWRADLSFVHVALADTRAPADAAHLPELALLDRPAAELRTHGALDADALQTLRRLRDTAPPEPSAFLDVFPTAGTLPPDLMTDTARVRVGADVEPCALAAMLAAAIRAAESPAEARNVARALIGAAVDLLGGPHDPGPLLHQALELTDRELTTEATRAAAVAAFAEVAAEPLRGALVARLPAQETRELRGSLYSLLSLPLPEEGLLALAARVPRWAQTVLADTLLLREMEDGVPGADRVRARLSDPRPHVVALGLAMAARVDDSRLIEPIVALGGHANVEIREAVLLALRQQTGRRVRALVVQRLGDPAPTVRIEALRYGVAHRLPEVLPWVEARFHEHELAGIQEAELRAICIAYGRLARDRAEGPLSDLALGRRRIEQPGLARLALHGLRAIGTPRARAVLQHVATEVPRLRHEAEALLAGDLR